MVSPMALGSLKRTAQVTRIPEEVILKISEERKISRDNELATFSSLPDKKFFRQKDGKFVDGKWFPYVKNCLICEKLFSCSKRTLHQETCLGACKEALLLKQNELSAEDFAEFKETAKGLWLCFVCGENKALIGAPYCSDECSFSHCYTVVPSYGERSTVYGSMENFRGQKIVIVKPTLNEKIQNLLGNDEKVNDKKINDKKVFEKNLRPFIPQKIKLPTIKNSSVTDEKAQQKLLQKNYRKAETKKFSPRTTLEDLRSVKQREKKKNAFDFRCPTPLKKVYRTREEALTFIKTVHPQDKTIHPYKCRCGALHIGH